MSNSVLPSGENISSTPDEILKYVNPDGLRQLLRQERIRWNLKPNKDTDYLSNTTMFKYTGDIHNEALYQRMEIRTFPDNQSYEGYAGINNDSGEFGIVHGLELWDYSLSEESLTKIINRTQIGASAIVPDKTGYGLENGSMVTKTSSRMSSLIFDPFDGRAYLYTNDDPHYVNNEKREEATKLPLRTVARIGDIPTRMTDLLNDFEFVSDPAYRHTDENFTTTNRYVLDNIDDRTFVYPEVSKDSSGNYINNYRVGLNGEPSYDESDGHHKYNSQPDFEGDRAGDAINSIGKGINSSGVSHRPGYMPGIFKSIEELERVDIVGQVRVPQTHKNLPGAKRTHNYYSFDGIWSPNWFDRHMYKDSYLAQSLHPMDMEIVLQGREPVPFSKLDQIGTQFTKGDLYQWRYNRITVKYFVENITITVVEQGIEYKVGDILRWSFGDEVLMYKVTNVGSQGQIQKGEFYNHIENRIFVQDPSTHGVGIPFTNTTSVGRNCKLAVYCKSTIETNSTQIKNNLYAYVDVVPSVRSDNTTEWSDVNSPDTQDGLINIRSTSSFPGYTGINSGRGGPAPNSSSSETRFHEHGGNATAGVHVHLFRYVVETQSPIWRIVDGVQVFLGRWVDQGPMGVERPSDIKALFLSNFDTNNFNNYYKFNLDILLDGRNSNPDATETNNANTLSQPYIHISHRDPEHDQKFHTENIDPATGDITKTDVTTRVMYINAATGVVFFYNGSHKNDPNFGYGNRGVGWFAIAGGIAR